MENRTIASVLEDLSRHPHLHCQQVARVELSYLESAASKLIHLPNGDGLGPLVTVIRYGDKDIDRLIDFVALRMLNSNADFLALPGPYNDPKGSQSPAVDFSRVMVSELMGLGNSSRAELLLAAADRMKVPAFQFSNVGRSGYWFGWNERNRHALSVGKRRRQRTFF